MARFLLLLLLLQALLAPSAAIFHLPGRHLPGRHRLAFATTAASPYERNFTQLIDHTLPSAGNFSQRYFVNAQYSNESGLHILYLEAGQAGDERVTNENYPHMAVAKALNATVWSLEHRFYGASRPFATLAAQNLPLMTSQQAVEDISRFIQTQNNASQEVNPKWVLFGDGYAGALALWHRQLRPEKTVGAVSSSAPVLPAMDFFAYQRDVEAAYASADPACYANILAGVNSTRHDVQNVYGRGNLSQALQLAPAFDQLSLSYNDFQNFFNAIAGFLALPVEYNLVNVEPFGKRNGIRQVCDIFNNASLNGTAKVVQLVVNITTEFTGSYGGGLANNYSDVVAYFKEERYDTDDGSQAADRLWLWQAGCNEFAWFPTADFGRGAFGSNIPENLFLDLCQDVYGPFVTIEYVRRAVNNTLNSHGRSTTYGGSNAYISSGTLDPWRSLGVTNATDPHSLVYQMQGVAHAADLKPPMDGDATDLVKARSLIQQMVTQWATANANSGNSGSGSGGSMSRAERLAPASAKAPAPVEASPAAASRPLNTWLGELKRNLPKPSPQSTRRRRRFTTRRRQQRHARPHPNTQPDAITYGSIAQPLDHFDPANSATWTNYFYQNDQYYNATAQRVFIMMGQEGPMAQEDVEEYWMSVVWAKAFGARVYSLEHRFYGASQPTGDLATSSLAFLTSEQYLADVAVFINSVNSAENFTAPQWVIFGGSYSGNLAAWFRLKYPQLCIGAIASSAPVQAKTDFYEYFQTVEAAIQAYGADGCWDSVHSYFTWLQQQLTTVAGRSYMSQELELCDPWDEPFIYEKDGVNLMSDASDDLAGSTQYDDQPHDYVKDACKQFKKMDSAEGIDTPLRRREDLYMAKLKRAVNKRRGWMHLPDTTSSTQAPNSSSSAGGDADCYDISWTGLVQWMQSLVTITDADMAAERSWIYQTCREFGYSQTTNFGYNVFESAIPVNWYIDLCTDVFGPMFNRTTIDANVRFTNAFYGGAMGYGGTNVTFINGSEDPWHTLGVGVYAPFDASVTSILIDGTSHCEDMYAPRRGDVDGVKAARKKARATLSQWLQQ